MEILGYIMMLLLVGFLGGGFITLNTTEQDRKYQKMRKTQGYE